MQMTMKRTLAAIAAALCLALALGVPRAWADPEPSATLQLENVGNGSVSVTVMDYNMLDDLTTLSVVFDIASLDAGADYLQAGFTFNNAIQAPVKTYTTDTEAGAIRLKIYISGATTGILPAASKEDGVYLGDINLGLTSNAPADATITASVNVPEGVTAFEGVTTEYVQLSVPAANLNVEGVTDVTVDQDVQNPLTDPSLAPRQGGGAGAGAGDASAVEVNDIVGQTAETNPMNVDVGDSLMNLVWALIAVIVVAALIIVIVVVRRKKNDGEPNDPSDSSH